MLSLGKGLIGHAIKSCQSLLIDDVRLDERYVPGRLQTRSEIVVPIMKNKRAIGALDVESDKVGAFSDADFEILSFFADAASISVQRAMLHNQILEKKNVEKQLQIASEVQSRILPQSPPVLEGYDFAGLCIPTFEIGGDYFDYIQIDENNIGIAVADISGDGIPAALIMTAFRALLRSQAKFYDDPSELMVLLNAQLAEFTRKKDFVTAFYGILNIKMHTFVYSNCGHNPPLLFRSDGKYELLELHGPSLSIVDDAEFKTGRVILNEDDQIVLYTDGVTEVFGKDNEEFGLDRLIKVIKPSINLSADLLLNKIVSVTKNFSSTKYYKDDYTLVVVKRKAEVEIINYSPDLKEHFKKLNLEWLNKYFKVEKPDERILNNPEKYIIKKGGFVLFASVGGTICGTTAMNKISDEVFELSKMAVSENYQGRQIGKKIALEAIERAKSLGAKKIVLETNNMLNKAVNLYKKLGFTEVKYETDDKSLYERPTFKMEYRVG
jgi:serine phosphatase RsbU (regulator of sigma subunit)/ribosomal protein S18 acetylase RimI-like enzyme